MRMLRVSLVGTVIVGLAVGFGGPVMAQDDEGAEPVTAQMLDDNAREAWNNDDVALLDATYAPDAVHRSFYYDGTFEAVGRDAIIEAALGDATVTLIAPLVELEAPPGELHWVEIVDVVAPGFAGQGSVCLFEARDDQIVRQDCLLSMYCPYGLCNS